MWKNDEALLRYDYPTEPVLKDGLSLSAAQQWHIIDRKCSPPTLQDKLNLLPYLLEGALIHALHDPSYTDTIYVNKIHALCEEIHTLLPNGIPQSPTYGKKTFAKHTPASMLKEHVASVVQEVQNIFSPTFKAFQGFISRTSEYVQAPKEPYPTSESAPNADNPSTDPIDLTRYIQSLILINPKFSFSSIEEGPSPTAWSALAALCDEYKSKEPHSLLTIQPALFEMVLQRALGRAILDQGFSNITLVQQSLLAQTFLTISQKRSYRDCSLDALKHLSRSPELFEEKQLFSTQTGHKQTHYIVNLLEELDISTRIRDRITAQNPKASRLWKIGSTLRIAYNRYCNNPHYLPKVKGLIQSLSEKADGLRRLLVCTFHYVFLFLHRASGYLFGVFNPFEQVLSPDLKILEHDDTKNGLNSQSSMAVNPKQPGPINFSSSSDAEAFPEGGFPPPPIGPSSSDYGAS